MITLVGHGYVGQAIASELRTQDLPFAWVRHSGSWTPSGPTINAAGYIGTPNVDACEEHKEETIEGNVSWPLQLEKKSDFPIIHISSGCIYNGYKEGGWTEEDQPNFSGSHYSFSKILGQTALKPYLNRSYLLRMRMPFGIRNHSKNLLTKFTNYKKLIDGLNSLSRVEDVAKTAVYFARNLPKAGIYNLVNPGFITAREIVEIMGIKKDWFTQEEFEASIKAPRSFCTLNSDKLQNVFPLDDVRDALSQCIVTETLPVAAVA
ncbi:MAG: sugar nucleotide-binding protein [Patescibacteria group bacterium]